MLGCCRNRTEYKQTMASITFHGAAREVTGSCHLIESPALGRVLLDCGMHQGGDAVDRIHDDAFSFRPDSIDAVILSHGHLDHSGMLPRLVNEGFNGPIHCTQATKGLLRILLEDAAGLYLRDLERDNLRRQRAGRQPIEPAYTERDVRRVLELCDGQRYRRSFRIGQDATLRFLDAGHILGSAIVELTLREEERDKKLVFSGDLGNSDSSLMNAPEQPATADIVLMESTYGNRDHRSMHETLAEFEEILHDTWQRGGSIMIPSFAVGRAQELLFHLGCMHQAGKLDGWRVFLDSPMAIEVTGVYDRWLHLMDEEDVRCLDESERRSLAGFLPSLSLCQSAEESMALNAIDEGAIIIAGSGMCTGGRIRHHFKHRIWRNNQTVIFAGFQARGTLGRLLVDGGRDFRMFGQDFHVKARIETLGGFSAHAGQSALVNWAAGFDNAPRLLLVHGEETAQDELARKLLQDKGISCEIPEQGDTTTF